MVELQGPRATTYELNYNGTNSFGSRNSDHGPPNRHHRSPELPKDSGRMSKSMSKGRLFKVPASLSTKGNHPQAAIWPNEELQPPTLRTELGLSSQARSETMNHGKEPQDQMMGQITIGGHNHSVAQKWADLGLLTETETGNMGVGLNKILTIGSPCKTSNNKVKRPVVPNPITKAQLKGKGKQNEAYPPPLLPL
ncbi:hypothetical protein FRX31_019266 [Thalictrum thalictroides]|uniref:Uncharacterized protein n=1 Tax=Thalictrum thalictroides TaxID=46969 RepID=A0A7J6W2H3_THATH|nr:hypothetical protein FRX31_019266 [Thalictrum thalictroides]